MPVADSGDLCPVRVMIGARAAIRTPAGTFNAWRLTPLATDSDGQPVDNNIVIWMSDDARRLPIKLEAELPVGKFVLVLRSATP